MKGSETRGGERVLKELFNGEEYPMIVGLVRR